MEQSELNRLINKILTGTASPEEKDRLQQYLKQQGLEEDLPANTDMQHWYPSGDQSARMLSNILAHVAGEKPAKVIRPLKWWRVAAAAVVAATVLTLSLLWVSGDHKKATAMADNSRKAFIRNEADSAQYLALPDGTKIWLNRGGSLEWTPNEFVTSRNVYLQGEAYFEVAHDPAHPFIVHSGELQTKVLGTAFNIAEDTLQHRVTVSLFTGKVSLAAETGATATLLPGQGIVFDEKAKQLKAADIPWYALAWKTGLLECRNRSLQEVISYLEKRYGITIQTTASLNGLKFSGTIALQDELPAVLDRLLFVYGLQFKRTGNKIIIQ